MSRNNDNLQTKNNDQQSDIEDLKLEVNALSIDNSNYQTQVNVELTQINALLMNDNLESDEEDGSIRIEVILVIVAVVVSVVAYVFELTPMDLSNLTSSK